MAAPAIASLRAGPAFGGGVVITAAAPALSAAPEANTNGSWRRASCQTGTAVFAIRAAVYVDKGNPNSAAAGRAGLLSLGNRPVTSLAAATGVVALLATSSHDPRLIG